MVEINIGSDEDPGEEPEMDVTRPTEDSEELTDAVGDARKEHESPEQ